MNVKEFKGDDGIYRVKEGEHWDSLIQVVGGRQIYELRNQEHYTYFKPRSSSVTDFRNTFTIEPATKDEEEYFNNCLEAGKYLKPPSDEFNGMWNDFHKEDGDYFIEKGDSTWIVRCLGDNDIYRVYANSSRFYEGSHAWGKSNEYKIRKAVQSESEHLNSCIEHGCYVEPPRSLDNSGELEEFKTESESDIMFKGKYKDFKPEDGDYVLKYCTSNPYVTRYQNGELVGEMVDQLSWFTTGDTWGRNHPIEARKATPIETKQFCLLYTSPSPRDRQKSRMPSSA